jgi:hypothetical protein
MIMSLFFLSFWAIMGLANYLRPSALHRGYAHIWLFILGWAILVAATVFEDRFHISAVYIFVVFESAVFLSTLVMLCELFALPKKQVWGVRAREDHDNRDHYRDVVPYSDQLIAATPGEPSFPASHDAHSRDTHSRDSREQHLHHDGATETTPLIGGGDATGESSRTTFATTYRRSISAIIQGTRKVQAVGEKPFGREQPWSGHLLSMFWWFQFLILGPVLIILSAQSGLVLLDAVKQTGTDGSNLLTPYILVSLFTLLMFLPITPFIHRITHHVPTFLFAVLVGTLIYNLAAFPFGPSNKYKAFFQQSLDLDTGAVAVHIVGVEQYVRMIIADLPSASGREITCVKASRDGLVDCSYDGSAVPPRLGGGLSAYAASQNKYSDLVTLNVTRGSGNTATFTINVVDSKVCQLRFKNPVANLEVVGAADWDDRFGAYPEYGVSSVQLWRRDWNTPWVVNVEWNAAWDSQDGDDAATTAQSPGKLLSGDELVKRAPGLDGYILCEWSDINTPGTIPAYDEALQFGPAWAAWTKMSIGLVEGRKAFQV